jgi:hypothetical protein
MQVQILESKEAIYPNTGRHVLVVMQCGKSKMSVSANSKYVNAVVHNASNRAWKGWGKFYRNFDEAFTNYRSAEARAMLDAAQALWNSNEVAA